MNYYCRPLQCYRKNQISHPFKRQFGSHALRALHLCSPLQSLHPIELVGPVSGRYRKEGQAGAGLW